MSDGAPRSVEWRFFLVGLIFLASALALAFWAFRIGRLTEDQRFILLWALPLASGFGAGAFAGSLSVRARGPIPGLLVTATGGFGVWVLTYFLLPVPSSVNHISRSPSEKQIVELKGRVDQLWGHYQAAEKIPSSAKKVRENAPVYGQRLSRVADVELSPGYRLMKYHYASYAHALAAAVAGATNEERLPNAKVAISLADTTLRLVDQLRVAESTGTADARALVDWMEKYRISERTRYVLAVSLAVEARFGGASSLEDARRALSEVPKPYLEEFPPLTNPHLKWVIEQSERGKAR